MKEENVEKVDENENEDKDKDDDDDSIGDGKY